MVTLADYEKLYGLDNGRYDTDILVIKKDDKIYTGKDLYDILNLDYELYDNRWEGPGKIIKTYTGRYEVSNWSSACVYDGKETKIVATPERRLQYIYASLHDDAKLEEMLKHLCPEIKEVIPPCPRTTQKPYLEYWMLKYGFTVEDFFTNDKYVVLSDSEYGHIFNDFSDLNLIDYDNIELTSIDIDVEDEDIEDEEITEEP